MLHSFLHSNSLDTFDFLPMRFGDITVFDFKLAMACIGLYVCSNQDIQVFNLPYRHLVSYGMHIIALVTYFVVHSVAPDIAFAATRYYYRLVVTIQF